MKRIVSFPFICLFVLLLAVPSARAMEEAGIVDRIRGEATRLAGGETSVLATGTPVFIGDVIKTGENARLQIRFFDSSSLKLGENAEMNIDELVYQPAGRTPESGAQSLRYVKGVFEFVSGRIGQNLPATVALNTPVATIGIRGTRVIAGELTVGMPPGQPHYGFQILEGAVSINAPLGSVTLDEPGEGTFLPLDRQAAPTPVRQWTPEEAAEARDAVAF